MPDISFLAFLNYKKVRLDSWLVPARYKRLIGRSETTMLEILVLDFGNRRIESLMCCTCLFVGHDRFHLIAELQVEVASELK